ncbi:MAG TPA: hypothetical protein VIL20_31100 [Sandaracinaceae bacterium]
MIRHLAIFVAIAFAGCAEVRLIDGPDAGDGGAPFDAAGRDAGARDSGPPLEPTPGGECDQQDDCGVCLACSTAYRQDCNPRAVACSDDEECSALWRCINDCPDDEACLAACGDAHPDGREPFLALYECAVCDACPADCRELVPTWCFEPPF